jgi:hypothetical protein
MSSNSEQSSEDLLKNSVCEVSLGRAYYYEIDPDVFQKIVDHCKVKGISWPKSRSGDTVEMIKKTLDSWLEENPGNEEIWSFFNRETSERLVRKAERFKMENDAETARENREDNASRLRTLVAELEVIRSRIKDFNSYIDIAKKVKRFSAYDMERLAEMMKEYIECHMSIVAAQKRYGIKASWDSSEKIGTSSAGLGGLPLSSPNSITPIPSRFPGSCDTHNDYVRSILSRN